MVTKLKKWKGSVVVVFSYVLGISLFLIGVFGLLYERTYWGSTGKCMEAVLEDDYQESAFFRGMIADRLEAFLCMACGDFLYDGYFYDSEWDGYDTSYATDFINEAILEETLTEEAQEDVPEEESPNIDAWKSAQNYHDQISEDKNLLYQISKGSYVLYSNMEEIDWNHSSKNLPEGYNFYLSFQGTKAVIVKDGKTIDIYGDGYYREDSDWSIPGYKNFVGKKEWEEEEIIIIMLAAKEPVLYGEGRWNYVSNDFYYSYQNYKMQRQQLVKDLLCLAAGVFLLAVYAFLKKKREKAGVILAGVTRKIWFEWKVLLFVLLPILLCIGMMRQMRNIEELTVLAEVAVEDGYWSDFSWNFWNAMEVRKCWLLVIFWLFYLFFCDLHNNKGSYKNGWIGKFLSVLNRKNLDLPLSKRMVKRSYGIFFLTLAQLIVLLIVACFFLLFYDRIEIGMWMVLQGGFVLVALLLVAEYFYQKKNRRLAEELGLLAKQIEEIHDGNYTMEAEDGKTKGFCAEDADIRHMSLELEEIRQGFETAVEERTKSERMKVELIANVSHDIKTPLTSIISYIQLLKQEEGMPSYVMDYIHILDEKSERLKNMVQDVFSVSKAASGQLIVELKELDLGKLLYQTLADMDEMIQKSLVEIKTKIPKEPLLVRADGQRMYRVFQNLIANAIKYSLKGSRVYIALQEENGFAIASVKNTSSKELDPEIDFSERFLRGDASRTDGGSGLGLSIAKSFTEACGGEFQIEIIADLFVVRVSFPINH